MTPIARSPTDMSNTAIITDGYGHSPSGTDIDVDVVDDVVSVIEVVELVGNDVV